MKTEALVAKDAGFDTSLVDEYSALRKSIDVDKNLLVVLKNASGMHLSGKEVSAEDMAAIKKLEDKIHTDELRVKEIHDRFPPPS